jgi:hypothetical protein
MHHVVIRDDDTCAFTPPAYLERIFRPFVGRGMPVTLAVIPEVRTNVRTPDGLLEGFLSAGRGPAGRFAPICDARELVEYLQSEPGYHVAQHGCHHDLLEFGGPDRAKLALRLDSGADLLRQAGFARPPAFVAPYDCISRAGYLEVASRFDVISTGWFEAGRVPLRWYGAYAAKKLRRRPHWRASGTSLLSHPGCLTSFHRPREGMMDSVRRAVEGSSLTVLVSHWCECFRMGVPDDPLIGVMHEVADWLASRQDVRVVTFADIASGAVRLS